MLYVGRAVLARIVSAVGQQVKSIRFRGGGGGAAAACGGVRLDVVAITGNFLQLFADRGISLREIKRLGDVLVKC